MAADDVRNAMGKLEVNIESAFQTPEIVGDNFRTLNLNSTAGSSTRQWGLSDWDGKKLAERGGFEPPVQVLARTTV
jgi:hypothetical protein